MFNFGDCRLGFNKNKKNNKAIDFSKLEFDGYVKEDFDIDILISDLTKEYFKALQYLEEYAKYILEYTEYTIDDIMIVDVDLGNNRRCKMLVCPKTCVISGHGILQPDYFIGVEDVIDKDGYLRGWKIIHDIPDSFKGESDD